VNNQGRDTERKLEKHKIYHKAAFFISSSLSVDANPIAYINMPSEKPRLADASKYFIANYPLVITPTYNERVIYSITSHDRFVQVAPCEVNLHALLESSFSV
jgi:hypothetical protein